MKPASDTSAQSILDYLLDEQNFVGLLIYVAVCGGLVGLVTHFFALPMWIPVTATVLVVISSPLVLRFVRGNSRLRGLMPPGAAKFRKSSSLALPVAATLAAIATGAYWLMYSLNVGSDGRAIMTGANNSVERLSDGSVLSLNAHSTVRVNETAQQRVAYLEAGEVIFSVTPDAKRPFVVETHLAKVVAPSGRFRVALDSYVEIEVYEGVVEVREPKAKAGSPSIVIEKGSPPYRVRGTRIAAIAVSGGDSTGLASVPGPS